MKSRRTFMKSLGLLALTIPQKGMTYSSLSSSKAISFTGFLTLPYLQNLLHDSVTIQVLTPTNSYTWLEYGIGKLEHTHFESKHGLKVANCRLFQFRLKDLKPNTTYSYRIHSKPITKMSGYDVRYGKEISTEVYTFKTPQYNNNNYNIVIYNDIHDRKESYEYLWNIRQQKDTDLVIFNGDMFNQLTSEEQLVNNFFNPISQLFATQKPFIFNRGNHETRGLYAREHLDYFDFPNGTTYQAFLLGSVFWIFLDSGEDKPDASKEYFGLADFDSLRLAQRDWLLKLVDSKAFKNAKFRAVVMHMPPLHSGDWHGPTHCTELFVPIFNNHKIDIVYSGHTHIAKFHPPSKENKFALFIGGGPKDEKRTIMDIQVNANSLKTLMIDEKGNVIQEWIIS